MKNLLYRDLPHSVEVEFFEIVDETTLYYIIEMVSFSGIKSRMQVSKKTGRRKGDDSRFPTLYLKPTKDIFELHKKQEEKKRIKKIRESIISHVTLADSEAVETIARTLGLLE